MDADKHKFHTPHPNLLTPLGHEALVKYNALQGEVISSIIFPVKNRGGERNQNRR